MATEKAEYKNVFWVSEAPKPATDPEEFKRFHELITKGRPDYSPWYIPLGKGEVVLKEKKTKDGTTKVTTISGKDPSLYGKWKDEKNRLTFEQAYKRLQNGFNVGAAATDTDPYVILDVDDMGLVGDTKPTLQAISRKRLGRHNFYITEEPARGEDNPYETTAKDNIPLDDAGELRSCWQYVVAPGSFVPCGPGEYNSIPDEDKHNAGKYSLLNPIEPATITFNELPEIFRAKRIADIKNAIEHDFKNAQKQKQDPGDKHSKSKLFDLTASDVLGYSYPDCDKFPSPLHGSSTGGNASFTGDLLHCWRHNVTHSGYSLLAVQAGLYDCGEAGKPHKGGCSYLKYDGEEIFEVWRYAKEHNHISDEDPIPSKALIHYATSNGYCNESDITDGWKLPAEAYNRALASLKEGGINPGRKEITEGREEPAPIDWKTPLKQAVIDTQDADIETKIEAARVILNDVLATMEPIARREIFLGNVCSDLNISNRAANDIYKKFEYNIKISSGPDWFNEKGKFVPPVLSEHVREHHHFVTLTDTKEIWAYDDKTGCYRPHGDVIIKQYAQNALGLFSEKKHIDEVVNHVSIETFEDRGVFDSDPDLINLQNGFYNISKHIFHEHTHTKKFTYAFPFKYNPGAKCPNFEKFLQSAGVDAKLIFEIFGYCLVPGYPIQSLFFFIGDGGNGKGTIERVLEHYLGSENIMGHSMQALEKNRYAMADLFGKRANICGDMPPTEIRDTSPIKITTGGEPITSPVIYKGNITFHNSAKMIFLLNHLPEFDDNTDSWDRRPVYVEFNNRVVGKDAEFKEEDMWTEEELSGIFNKCLEVLPDLLKRGSFTGMKSIQENRAYRQRRSNPIETFIEDCTNYDDEGRSLTSNTYAAYLKWCTENRETCLTENVFGRKLLEKFKEFRKIRPMVGGNRAYRYSGFVLKEGYNNLNILEESVKYEESKGYNEVTGEDNPGSSLPESTEPGGEIAQDKPNLPMLCPYIAQDKKTVFSDTVDTIGLIYLGCSSKLSVKKIISVSEPKTNDDKYRDKIEQVSRAIPGKSDDTTGKNRDLNLGNPRQNLGNPGENLDTLDIIKDLLNKWEAHHGRIFAGNKVKVPFDVSRYSDAKGIDPNLIFEAVERRSKGRCVDCGSEETHHETKGEGRRCNACHKKYSNPPAAVIPDEISLEPAGVTQ